MTIPGPEPPPGLLESAAALSRRLGSDPEFARGGGGNTSAKANGVLWIKPSGMSLAAITPESFVPLEMEPLLAVLAADVPDEPAGSDPVLRAGMAARLRRDDDRRPSVEFLFHALLPEAIVAHTHPTTVNALTCAARGEEAARELFGDEAVWIPYVDPGLPLARRIAAERDAVAERTGRPAPRVLLLGNHGLVVSGDSVEEIEDRSQWVVGRMRERLGPVEDPELPDGEEARSAASAEAVGTALAELLGAPGHRKVVVFDGSPLARWIGSTAEGRAFVLGGPLTPDEIVYAGSRPLLIGAHLDGNEARERLSDVLVEHHAATGFPPSVVVVAGLGAFAVADSAALAATARDVYLDAARIAIGAGRLGGSRPLAAEERRFIEEWEAEAYRRRITAATGLHGRVGAPDS